MEKLKLSLLQKWDISDQYTFVHSTGILNDGRALIFTREAEVSDKYCVIMFSPSEVKKIAVCDCSDSGRNYPVFFMCGEGFGIIKDGKQIEYYRGDFSVPEIIPIKNGSLISGKVIPEKAQQRCFQVISDSSLIPVCFENKIYYGLARCFGLLDIDFEVKSAKWKSFLEIDKKAFVNYDDSNDEMPKIDSLKIFDNEIYAFTSGESTTSVNKWGLDYYALAKISDKGKVTEKLIESDNLKSSGKKGGVNGTFTNSEYVIMTPLFKNDDWNGKQKVFSLSTGEYFDIGFPKGMAKHTLHNISENLCLTSLYNRGLREIAVCKIETVN
ncbi:hypothetical protein GCWU000282_00720 [Catonella morbi ATCC 51271]|uniref:Uncharacterized protein n=1 Tax=Catonella morbi ATCC 51271 TaxID=592026 RepID=V2ZBR1_9FIRM|nr:hypothetical protein [Catonella morbi]ESL04370.1 hypothetical protein GCWU000282_00720 [Catonella morbi ATCC 51271]